MRVKTYREEKVFFESFILKKNSNKVAEIADQDIKCLQLIYQKYKNERATRLKYIIRSAIMHDESQKVSKSNSNCSYISDIKSDQFIVNIKASRSMRFKFSYFDV